MKIHEERIAVKIARKLNAYLGARESIVLKRAEKENVADDEYHDANVLYGDFINLLDVAFTSARNNKENTMPEEVLGGVEIELPRYRSHKEIHALQIENAEHTRSPSESYSDTLTLEFSDDRYRDMTIKGEKAKRLFTMIKNHWDHTGEFDPGYYVVYEDGYVSWSPTEVFEKGHTAIE